MTIATDAQTGTTGSPRSDWTRPLTVTSVVFLAVVALASISAPLLTPYGPLTQDLGAVGQTPSAAHWLGTDTLGRDILTRILFGGRPALVGAFEATAVFAVLGTTFGLVAGYSRGLADRAITAGVDLLMSLPSLVVLLAVLALFGNSLSAAMVTLGFFSAGGLVRVVRASTKSVREELYVAAATVFGIGTARILVRHIAPRLVGPIVIQVSLFLGVALVVQSGLGFLNLGVSPPAPSWGGMVAEASQVIDQNPWMLVPSGGVITLVILALGQLGDAIRDGNSDRQSRGGAVAQGVRSRASGSARPVVAPSALLEVDGLDVEFAVAGDAQPVVRDVSFSVRRGELVGLVGESGSGKSVTALATMGLLPQNAAVRARRIIFDQRDYAGASGRAFRAIRGTGIGLVSQEPMSALDPSFTVGHQLREVIRLHAEQDDAEPKQVAIQLLRSVRIPHPELVSERYPHELSGGMAQRVVIAMALAGRPDLLIADEPTTALDVTVQAEILDLLRQLRDERGTAILIVTHDLGVVADFCERVIVIRSGSVVEERDVEALFASPSHEYTRGLIEATPSLVPLPGRRGSAGTERRR